MREGGVDQRTEDVEHCSEGECAPEGRDVCECGVVVRGEDECEGDATDVQRRGGAWGCEEAA